MYRCYWRKEEWRDIWVHRDFKVFVMDLWFVVSGK